MTTNLWYTIRIYQRTGAHLVQWCWCWDADNADYADYADDAEILIMLIMLIMLMMLMMLTVILVTPRMSRLWWRRKGSQGSSSITASSGRRKDSQHRWRLSSPSSSAFNRPKICEHSIWCKKVRIGSRVAHEILVRVWTPHSAKPHLHQYHYHNMHDHHHHNNYHWLYQLGAKPPYPTLARAGVRRERGHRQLQVNIHFFFGQTTSYKFLLPL